MTVAIAYRRDVAKYVPVALSRSSWLDLTSWFFHISASVVQKRFWVCSYFKFPIEKWHFCCIAFWSKFKFYNTWLNVGQGMRICLFYFWMFFLYPKSTRILFKLRTTKKNVALAINNLSSSDYQDKNKNPNCLIN